MTKFITALFIFSFVIFFGSIYLNQRNFPLPQDNLNEEKPETQSPCLAETEEARYELVNQKNSEDSAIILIRGMTTNSEKRMFRIPLFSATDYHPLEVHRCGVYAVRKFNYDYERGTTLPGYKTELWQYDFQGSEKFLVALSGSEKGFFRSDFRIDPNERYLVLQKGFLGSKEENAIVFKDLKTIEDVFVFPMTVIEKEAPDIIGDMSFAIGNIDSPSWSKDGRYFWFETQIGANTLGAVRIDTETWTYKLLSVPPDVLGGDPLNVENGWITVHPGNVWSGFAEFDEEEKAKRRAEGVGTKLYIHNLLTGKRQFVAKTDEPLWYFKPIWLSEIELEYTLPTGEKKTYVIR